MLVDGGELLLGWGYGGGRLRWWGLLVGLLDGLEVTALVLSLEVYFEETDGVLLPLHGGYGIWYLVLSGFGNDLILHYYKKANL